MKWILAFFLFLPSVIHAQVHFEREHQFMACISINKGSEKCLLNLSNQIKIDIDSKLKLMPYNDKIYALNSMGVMTEKTNIKCKESGLSSHSQTQCLVLSDLTYLRFLEVRY